MKIVIIAIVLAAAALGAPPAAQKKAAPAPARSPQPVTIPKDAVQNPDGSYSYTDKDGKKWTYLKTPFGITKAAASDKQAPPADLSMVKAIDKGDTVRFERTGPFGVTTWEKKKSELNDDERQVLDRQNAPPAADTQNPKT